MIIDTLENASAYESLGPRFAKAFEYLRSGRAQTDEPGTHKIEGDDLFASVQAYTTKPHDQGKWEAHRAYADIQFVVTGSEQMGYAPLNTLTPDGEYDSQNDVAFFKGSGSNVLVPAGTFTVFFPQDAHMPCLANGSQSDVRKVVLKIRIPE